MWKRYLPDEIEELGSPKNSMAGRLEATHKLIRNLMRHTDHRGTSYDVLLQL